MGLGIRIWGSGFGSLGLGLRIWISGIRSQDLDTWVLDLWV